MTSGDRSKDVPDHGGRTSRNIVVSILGNFFPTFISLVSAPILAHALGVDGRGVVAGATAPLTLAITMATFGVPETVTYTVARYPALARVVRRRALAIIVCAGAVATTGVVLAANWLSAGNIEVHKLILVAAIAIVPNLMVAVIRGLAAAYHQWNRVMAERVIGAVLRLAIIIPFWLTGNLSPFVATVALAAMPVLGAVAYWGLRTATPAPSDAKTAAPARYRTLISYGSRVWIGSISGILLLRLDQTLITPLTGSYELGLYVVAVAIGELPLIVHTSVRDVMFALESAKNSDDRMAAASRISSTLSAATGLLVGVSMIWWVPVLFGAGFRSAIPVAAILLVAVVLVTPGSLAGVVLSARGRPGLRSASLVVACILNLALLLVLVPRHGAIGAACATLAGNVASSSLNLYFLSRYFSIPARTFVGFRGSDLATIRRLVRQVLGRA